MKVLCVFLGVILLVSSQLYPNCTGNFNNNSVVYQEPVLLNSTANGLKYYIEDPNDNTTYLYIAILQGNAYEMGYAYGTLFKEEITTIVDMMLDFISYDASSWISGVPEWIREIRPDDESSDMRVGLEFEMIATEHFTNQRYYEEFKGIADATGIPQADLERVNLFPELIQAHCSIAGIWNPASASGKLLQLRTLDWDASAPMNLYPLVTIRHSNENGSVPYATFGWAGLIGTLAGYSGLIGISEADWLPQQDNTTSIFGTPWMYALRDVLQFGTNLDTAITMLEETSRTYKVYLGVGSKEDNQLRGLQYDAADLFIYTDTNWSLPFSPVHPQMDGIMYWDKSSAQNRPCFGNVFETNYGNITAQTLYGVAAPLDTTGDTMVAVYDFGADVVYISFSHYQTATPAYTRPMMFLNMSQLLSILPNETVIEA